MVTKTKKNKKFRLTQKKRTRKMRKRKRTYGGKENSNDPINITVLTLNVGHLKNSNQVEIECKPKFDKLFEKWELLKLSPEILVLCLQECNDNVHTALLIYLKNVKKYNLINSERQSQWKLGSIFISILKLDLSDIFPKTVVSNMSDRCELSTSGFAKGYASIKVYILGIYVTFYSIHLPVFHGIDKPNNCLRKMLTNSNGNVILAGDYNYRTTDIKKITIPTEIDYIKNMRCVNDNNPTILARFTKDNLTKQTVLLKELQLTETQITFCETCRKKEKDINAEDDVYKRYRAQFGQQPNNRQPLPSGESEYDPIRKPSWCDRVLYRLNEPESDNELGFVLEPAGETLADRYNSYRLSDYSDHDAVYHHFVIKLKRS